MTDLQAKKEWLQWLLTSIQFQTREVPWILDYINTHDLIVKNCSFVEHADATPRGLVLVPNKEDGPSLTLYIQGHPFQDPDQIFHEIRLNWKQTLFIEVVMEGLWDSPIYLGSLEDNPYYKWNDAVDQSSYNEVDAYLDKQKKEEEVQKVMAEIDACLDRDDRKKFTELSKKLQQLIATN